MRLCGECQGGPAMSRRQRSIKIMVYTMCLASNWKRCRISYHCQDPAGGTANLSGKKKVDAGAGVLKISAEVWKPSGPFLF